jgi:glutamate-1-semialdehyde 2,1-aminomutase
MVPGVFEAISSQTATFIDGISRAASRTGVPIQANYAGTMFGFYFLKEEGARITDYDSAKKQANTNRYGRFFHAMLEEGYYFAPSQFEAGFMSSAHTKQNVEEAVEAFDKVLGQI